MKPTTQANAVAHTALGWLRKSDIDPADMPSSRGK
jgi:hypothetical protein